MGDSDLETMANVTRAEFDFNDESFDPISEQAKDFISKLLVKDKKWGVHFLSIVLITLELINFDLKN